MQPSAPAQPTSLVSGATHDSSPRQSHLCSQCHHRSTSAQRCSFRHCSGIPCQSICACLGDATGQGSCRSPTGCPPWIIPNAHPCCPCGSDPVPARHHRFGADPGGREPWPWKDWALGSCPTVPGVSAPFCPSAFLWVLQMLEPLLPVLLEARPPQPSPHPHPQNSTYHTAHHCCHRSRCPHRSATGSGCNSRSGRGTRPPHTPGGLWAQSSQAAAGPTESPTEQGSQATPALPRGI